MYDIRIPCEVPGLCYDFANVESFLARPEVLEALHVAPEASAWQSCNMDVNKVYIIETQAGEQGLRLRCSTRPVTPTTHEPHTGFPCRFHEEHAGADPPHARGGHRGAHLRRRRGA